MKMKENDATGRKRGKMKKKYIIITQKRRLCSFYQRTPLTRLDRPEKNYTFFDRQLRAGPVPIAPISIPKGPGWKGACRWRRWGVDWVVDAPTLG